MYDLGSNDSSFNNVYSNTTYSITSYSETTSSNTLQLGNFGISEIDGQLILTNLTTNNKYVFSYTGYTGPTGPPGPILPAEIVNTKIPIKINNTTYTFNLITAAYSNPAYILTYGSDPANLYVNGTYTSSFSNIVFTSDVLSNALNISTRPYYFKLSTTLGLIRNLTTTRPTLLLQGNASPTGTFDQSLTSAASITFPTGYVSSVLFNSNNLYGLVDGPVSPSTVFHPTAVANDLSGNIYVACVDRTIKKITPQGAVLPYAGFFLPDSQPLSCNGKVSMANFFISSKIVVDSLGNKYVSDYINHVIMKLNTSGILTVFAGVFGQYGYKNPTSSNNTALFCSPTGLAVDNTNNLYVADTGNSVIRKITPTGVVSTYCGTGVNGYNEISGNNISFSSLTDLTIDSFNNLYVTATGVHKIAQDGTISTISRIRLYRYGITIDNNQNIYLADGQGIIRKMDMSGNVTIVAGSQGQYGPNIGYLNGVGTNALFNQPNAVVCDSAGNIYVADSGNNVIRRISTSGVVTTVAGSPSGQAGYRDDVSGNALFNFPTGIAIGPSGLLVVEGPGIDGGASLGTNSTIRNIASNGTVSTLSGTGPCALFANMNYTSMINDSTGNIYLNENNYMNGTTNIRKISTNGTVSTPCLNIGSVQSEESFTIDSNKNVYLMSFNILYKITPSGVKTVLAGSSTSGYLDGTGTNATFNTGKPGIVCDSSGNIYVVDSKNYLIRKVTPEGVVTTLAGTAGSSDQVDGTGSSAKFSFKNNFGYALKIPIIIDSAQNLYVADTNTIRKITPSGVVTTFAGSYLDTSGNINISYSNGTGSNALFTQTIRGLSIDVANNIYVVENINSTVRKISPSGAVTTVLGTGQKALLNIYFNDNFIEPGIKNSMVTDNSGNIYITDVMNNCIRMLSPQGIVTTIAPKIPDVWTNYNANLIRSYTRYMRNNDNNFYYFMTSSYVSTTACGNNFYPVNSFPNNGTTTYLIKCAQAISRYNVPGTYVPPLRMPGPMCIDTSGNKYIVCVTANYTSCITKIDNSDNSTTINITDPSGNSFTGGTRDIAINGITIDSYNNIYFTNLKMVYKMTQQGVISILAGKKIVGNSHVDGTGTSASFNAILGITYALDNNNRPVLYVIDNKIICKIDIQTAVVSTFAGGNLYTVNPADGTGTNASFSNYINEIKSDLSGNVYVADPLSIRMITPSGVVSTISGSYTTTDAAYNNMPVIAGAAYDCGSDISYIRPITMTIDNQGNIYVLDATSLVKLTKYT